MVERQASPVGMVPFQGQALGFREGSWKLNLVHPLQATYICQSKSSYALACVQGFGKPQCIA